MKKFVKIMMIIVAVLFAIFLMGRFGWKLGGFGACQDAGIDSVEVSERAVRMTGFYPGSFPEGFCGYYCEGTGWQAVCGLSVQCSLRYF